MAVIDFVKQFIDEAKESIISLAKTELSNEEKKIHLDDYVTSFVLDGLDSIKLGWFGKIVIKKWVVPNIPVLTQAIFDLLKTKIEQI